VQVLHIHVPWKEARGAHGATRTREEARELAEESLRLALAGEDFGKLTERFHDQGSGLPTTLRVAGRSTQPEQGERREQDLPKALTRLLFALDVGEAGICRDHSGESPYGWHVVKRIE
jgi:hypothetical protein